MAGVASHMRLAVREFRIDILRHVDHVARDFLRMLFVARKIALHVAEVALHAQAAVNERMVGIRLSSAGSIFRFLGAGCCANATIDRSNAVKISLIVDYYDTALTPALWLLAVPSIVPSRQGQPPGSDVATPVPVAPPTARGCRWCLRQTLPDGRGSERMLLLRALQNRDRKGSVFFILPPWL